MDPTTDLEPESGHLDLQDTTSQMGRRWRLKQKHIVSQPDHPDTLALTVTLLTKCKVSGTCSSHSLYYQIPSTSDLSRGDIISAPGLVSEIVCSHLCISPLRALYSTCCFLFLPSVLLFLPSPCFVLLFTRSRLSPLRPFGPFRSLVSGSLPCRRIHYLPPTFCRPTAVFPLLHTQTSGLI